MSNQRHHSILSLSCLELTRKLTLGKGKKPSFVNIYPARKERAVSCGGWEATLRVGSRVSSMLGERSAAEPQLQALSGTLVYGNIDEKKLCSYGISFKAAFSQVKLRAK